MGYIHRSINQSEPSIHACMLLHWNIHLLDSPGTIIARPRINYRQKKPETSIHIDFGATLHLCIWQENQSPPETALASDSRHPRFSLDIHHAIQSTSIPVDFQLQSSDRLLDRTMHGFYDAPKNRSVFERKGSMRLIKSLFPPRKDGSASHLPPPFVVQHQVQQDSRRQDPRWSLDLAL